MKKFLFSLFGLLMICPASWAFPVLTGNVVDEANLLSETEKRTLTQTLKQVEPSQVVAVSVNSLDGMEIEEYGVSLGRHWGIGRKNINDGVLVIIAPNQRSLRIEVGYGLEGILTDFKSSKITNNIMLPLARKGLYGQALIKGSEAVCQVLKGNPIPTSNSGNSNSLPVLVIICMIIIGFFILIIRKIISSKVVSTIKIPSSPKELASSRKSRIKFFAILIPFLLFYSIFFIVGFSMLQKEPIFALFWLSFTTIHFFLMIGISAIVAWRKNPYFPSKELMKGSNNSGFWSSGSHHSGWHSGGGFSGGGGSFGGGGSSGRW